MRREKAFWRARLMSVAGLTALAGVCVAPMWATGSAAARQRSACRAPDLSGLTFRAAQLRAGRAGCALRLQGARLERGDVQTVARQSPAPGRRALTVTVWLNPFCHREADYAPEIREPVIRRGLTELVSGFYLVGGPADRRFSAPACRLPEPPPGPGTVEVVDAGGLVVATKTSTAGRFVKMPLPPGTYTIRGTFLDAIVNGGRPKESESVVIPAGHTVRQDFFFSIR